MLNKHALGSLVQRILARVRGLLKNVGPLLRV